MTGVAIASTLNIVALKSLGESWWQIVVAVAITFVGAASIGYLLMRFTKLPGTTGAWGALPGAAAAMGSLAAENAGDGVLVSVMQYLRVAFVVGTGPAVTHWLMTLSPGAEVTARISVSVNNQATAGFSENAVGVLIAIVGVWLAVKTRVLAGTLLVPLVLGSCWLMAGQLTPHIPTLLLQIAFAIIGWGIGLQFKKELARPLLESLPAMLWAIIGLMAICGLSAWLLTLLTPVSAVTAYLATSPGGLDSVAAIALGSSADMNFVTAVQTMRLFSVVLLGPSLAKYMSRLVHRSREADGEIMGKDKEGTC
jgi:membrane AbrB-like protein